MAATDAPWWDNPGTGSDAPVVRHVPAGRQDEYHYPDSRQLDRMRSGLETVVVPKARRDGGSSAFDCSRASVVHVDPNAPDGGTVVDLRQVSRQDLRQALSQSTYPHEVFYKLGISPDALEPRRSRPATPRRENPLLPNSYVVPAAAQDGGQVSYMDPSHQEEPMPLQPVPPLQPLSSGPAPTNGPVPAAQPAYYPPQPQQSPYYPPPPQGYGVPVAPPAVDPNLQHMLGHLMQGMANLGQQVAAMRQAEPRRPKRRLRVDPGVT